MGALDLTWDGPLVEMVWFVQKIKIVERENLAPPALRNGLLERLERCRRLLCTPHPQNGGWIFPCIKRS